MGTTGTARASLGLRATTSLDSAAALEAVRRATGEVKGGGASIATSGFTNVGAKVHVERERPGSLELSINSGKRIVELMTMTAKAAESNGKTTLTIRIQDYKTTQQKVLGFIPAGPKMIHGMSPYKRFLELVSQGLKAADPTAQVTVAQQAA